MLSRAQRGVTLLELMIVLAIVAFTLAMGLPSFTGWIRNTHNRTAAESVLNGLQLARAEAVRRNTQVRFTLTSNTGRVDWNVGCVSVTTACLATIQSRPASEGSAQARVGISTAAIPSPIPAGHFGTALAAGAGLPAGVTFDGLGRPISGNADFKRADFTNATATGTRRYIVIIGQGGQVRMCDPALPFASNPQGCS